MSVKTVIKSDKSLKTIKSDTGNKSDKLRIPDLGPCDIERWRGFLQKSKEKFYKKWDKPLIFKETLSDFDQIAFLGNGSFGEVILVKHKENEKYFAMKAMEKDKIIKSKQLENIKNEKMILQCIDFPLAVYLLYYFKDNSYIYFIMPFIPGGELFGHLSKLGSFNEVQARFYICQVILALEYLHYLDFIYRDLKPENILMDQTGYLKLTDFGFCKRMRESRTFTLCGTPEYLAPEVILSKGYGKSVDWWGVGVLMYELVAGVSPFQASTPMKIFEKIIYLKYTIPQFFSPDLKDLIRNLLQIDLSRRYGNLKKGVEDIKSHKWFKKINWMSILNRKLTATYKPTCPADPENLENFEKTHWQPLKISNEDLYAKEFEDF